MMRDAVRKLLFNRISGRHFGPAPSSPKADLDEEDKEQLRASLVRNFYAQVPAVHGIPVETFLLSEGGKQDMAHHLEGRAAYFRSVILPWLEAFADLQPANVLEIGPGTGSSTAIFGAASRSVQAIDIDVNALRVARDRVRLHGLRNVTIAAANGAKLDQFRPDSFDLVMFIATLEHMTYEERLRSLRISWSLLKTGGFVLVVDTPNRLWFFDGHTGMLPFYHWLPDELAIPYADRSPRQDLRKAFARPRGDAVTKLARWGRGVSYHEFDLAIGLDRMEAVSSLQAFQRENEPGAQEWWRGSQGGRYQALLCEAAPQVPLPFLEDGLNLLLRKR